MTQRMTDRPILFSAPMVQAILKGRKTMTRRIIKPQPDENGVSYMKNAPLDYEQIYKQEWKPYKWDNENGEAITKHPPYGYPGDRLWVRETSLIWTTDSDDIVYATDSNYDACRSDMRKLRKMGYPNDRLGNWKVIPSIFMPRSASRITLRITNIRVERLQDISMSDAIREGVEEDDMFNGAVKGYKAYDDPECEFPSVDPRMSFFSLWRLINGDQSYLSNPWVWVIEFKVL